jgi:hypothetical protein
LGLSARIHRVAPEPQRILLRITDIAGNASDKPPR